MTFARTNNCRHVAKNAQRPPAGLSLLELLGVVAILGVIAAIALGNYRTTANRTKSNACYVTKGEIEVQVQLWHRHHGAWPLGNLSDIGADANYFPDGLPVCPVDGSAYTIDAATHRVVGHTH